MTVNRVERDLFRFAEKEKGFPEKKTAERKGEGKGELI